MYIRLDFTTFFFSTGLHQRRCESTTCAAKMLHQHFYSSLTFHTKKFTMSNLRVIQTKLTPSWITLQIRLLEPANPWQSLYRKNKHGYYAGTHPIHARNGALGMQLIDRKSHGIFQYFHTSSGASPSSLYVVTHSSATLFWSGLVWFNHNYYRYRTHSISFAAIMGTFSIASWAINSSSLLAGSQ